MQIVDTTAHESIKDKKVLDKMFECNLNIRYSNDGDIEYKIFTN